MPINVPTIQLISIIPHVNEDQNAWPPSFFFLSYIPIDLIHRTYHHLTYLPFIPITSHLHEPFCAGPVSFPHLHIPSYPSLCLSNFHTSPYPTHHHPHLSLHPHTHYHRTHFLSLTRSPPIFYPFIFQHPQNPFSYYISNTHSTNPSLYPFFSWHHPFQPTIIFIAEVDTFWVSARQQTMKQWQTWKLSSGIYWKV